MASKTCLFARPLHPLRLPTRSRPHPRLRPPSREYIWADEEQGLYILRAKLQLASLAVISLSTGTNNVSKGALTKEQVEFLALQIHAVETAKHHHHPRRVHSPHALLARLKAWN